MNNEKHIFHAFHHIGYQKSYASNYRKFLMIFLNNLKDQFESFEDEQYRFERSSGHFYYTMELTKEDLHSTFTKNSKNQKNTKNHKKNMYVKKHKPYFICRYHDDTVRLPRHSILQCAPRRQIQDDDNDIPSLVGQDEVSHSTAGYEDDSSNDGSLPDLFDQSVSTAQYDSEDAFRLGEDENDDRDFILEGAFRAQVTFVDDLNNMITLGSDNDEE